MSKKKRLVKKILNALREPAPLNYNKGPLIREFTRTHSKKDRRHSGRVEAKYCDVRMKYKDAHAEAIDPVEFYDDWVSYRDGLRDLQVDREWKKKQSAIRKARKQRFKY